MELLKTQDSEPKEEYEIEAIIGHRKKEGKFEFLVCWTGYSPQFDTWAAPTDLTNAPEILWDYKKTHWL